MNYVPVIAILQKVFLHNSSIKLVLCQSIDILYLGANNMVSDIQQDKCDTVAKINRVTNFARPGLK